MSGNKRPDPPMPPTGRACGASRTSWRSWITARPVDGELNGWGTRHHHYVDQPVTQNWNVPALSPYRSGKSFTQTQTSVALLPVADKLGPHPSQ